MEKNYNKPTKTELVREIESLHSQVKELKEALTERMQALEVLQTERDRFEMVAQSIGAGVNVISRDYRIIWVNKNLKEMFGDIRGKTCYVVMNKRTEICPGCCVKELFETGKERVFCEQIVSDRKGNVVHLNVIATPIKDEEGNITAALEMIMPTTGAVKGPGGLASLEVNDSSEAKVPELDGIKSEFASFLTDGFKSVLDSRAKSKRWLSMDDVTAYLGIKRDTAYKWIKRKGMPAHKVGHLWKFKQSEIDEWLGTMQGG
jgi:excisionase family DNA binding protein